MLYFLLMRTVAPWMTTLRRRQLGLLAQSGTESSVLDAELVDKGTAFFPAPVGFVCGSQGGIEELGTGFEGFDVSGAEMRVWTQDNGYEKKLTGLCAL